uniref:AP2/ERF domain-containing protein n=1 Tax=Oryza sativa subsp. japonica TaxID=39947 RepID=Q5Z9D3_ORYSJ|nr:hypothetical protein [Oryza sativa Japonica Group]
MRGNYHPSGSGGGGGGGGGKRWKGKGVTGIQLRWPLGTSLEDSSAALLCHLKKIGWCPRPPPRRCSPRPSSSASDAPICIISSFTTRDTFNTAEDAAMAYDRETFKLHSKNVRLNFSDRFLRKGCVVRLTTGDI